MGIRRWGGVELGSRMSLPFEREAGRQTVFCSERKDIFSPAGIPRRAERGLRRASRFELAGLPPSGQER